MPENYEVFSASGKHQVGYEFATSCDDHHITATVAATAQSSAPREDKRSSHLFFTMVSQGFYKERYNGDLRT